MTTPMVDMPPYTAVGGTPAGGFLPRIGLVAGVRFGATLRQRDFRAQVNFVADTLESHFGAGDHLYIGTSFGTDAIVAAAYYKLFRGGSDVPTLHVVAPFVNYAATWSEQWRAPFEAATADAQWHYAGDEYTAGAYTRREQEALRLADTQAQQLSGERMMLTFWSGERNGIAESILDAHAHGFTVIPLMDRLNDALRDTREYDA